MAARADDDEMTNVICPTEAVVMCLVECNEIYTNLFDTEGAEVACREMGKTVRAFTRCLSRIGSQDNVVSMNDNACTFEDDDDA